MVFLRNTLRPYNNRVIAGLTRNPILSDDSMEWYFHMGTLCPYKRPYKCRDVACYVLMGDFGWVF